MFPADFADQRRSTYYICENQRDLREKEKKSLHKIFLTIFTIVLRKVSKCHVAA
jgi:hypothetical protein